MQTQLKGVDKEIELKSFAAMDLLMRHDCYTDHYSVCSQDSLESTQHAGHVEIKEKMTKGGRSLK